PFGWPPGPEAISVPSAGWRTPGQSTWKSIRQLPPTAQEGDPDVTLNVPKGMSPCVGLLLGPFGDRDGETDGINDVVGGEGVAALLPPEQAAPRTVTDTIAAGIQARRRARDAAR